MYNSGQSGMMPLPNATGVLVLGILSIVFSFCYGIVGLILGIIALSIMGKPISMYKDNPGYYTESSYKNLQAGKVCAIIGVSLSVLIFIYIIFVFAVIGFSMHDWPGMR
ncbi:MAG: hypothetical protein KKA07_13400 [Bacteroidetes bacterium]|nr:hypothetical protein [Bacteroidota bacterium]MBU1720055.1 hypothetical protein [Bacteroidota bacterium]